MLASTLVSAAGGRLSQPVAGGVKPQMFLNSNIKSVTSKSFEDRVKGFVGYSLAHCVGFRIFRPLRFCSVGCTGGLVKTPWSPAGGWMLSNLSLNT